MSAERAVIYVESGTSLRTSAVDPSHSHQHPSSMGKNYVIKIQIGEENVFNPVRIDVSTAGRTVALKKKPTGERHCPCEEQTSSSSGQSSPRSDMTPSPRMNLNISSGNRFGSETSESDTESDISSEFRPLSCPAAQFALREICEVETPSLPFHKGIIKKCIHVPEDDIKASTETLTPPISQSTTPIPSSSNSNLQELLKIKDTQGKPNDKPVLAPIMTLAESMALKRVQREQEQREKLKILVDESGFHVNEIDGIKSMSANGTTKEVSDESLTNFAGYRDIFARKNGDMGKQILSDRGTIRGVKNRVRDGIATFLQSKDSKTYSEKEQGRVVVYTTSMGVVRTTFQQCQKVKQILRNLLVKFDERDCYMNRSVQDEIRQRLPNHQWLALPQVFLEGQLLGDADVIEKLNETGELRDLLKPYKSLSVLTTCEKCGGFRMLPCQICNGSKKSVHRNHFTTEFIALKCMQCDPSGLVRCDLCNAPDS